MKKFIDGFNNRYEIYDDGRVYSHKSKKFLSPISTPQGYLYVNLSKNGNFQHYFVHVLVAKYFSNGDPDEDLVVHHIDGNKQNNHYSNLEWCTNQENMAHAYLNKLNSGDRFRKRIRNVEFDTIFNSRTEACKSAGLNFRGSLSGYLRGERNYAGTKDGIKLTWECLQD